MEDVAEATTKKNHEKALNTALVKHMNELQTQLLKQQNDISVAMGEGKLVLSKIYQTHLFCDDVLN